MIRVVRYMGRMICGQLLYGLTDGEVGGGTIFNVTGEWPEAFNDRYL